MRSKDKTLMAAIEKFVCDYTDKTGISPTMQEVADSVGSSKATVQRYIAQMCDDGIIEYSGYRTMTSTKTKMQAVRVPVLGTIACGKPILAQENHEDMVGVPDDIHADFCLRCQGDSMINARIYDGDIVFIRQQPSVENGEIAAVLIDDTADVAETTLKRVYIYDSKVMLVAENPQYPPMSFEKEEMNSVRILGKAVAFLSGVR